MKLGQRLPTFEQRGSQEKREINGLGITYSESTEGLTGDGHEMGGSKEGDTRCRSTKHSGKNW